MGLAEPMGPGLLDWCESGAPAGALRSLAIEVAEGLHLIPRGIGPTRFTRERCGELGAALSGMANHVVVDSGEPVRMSPGSGADPLVGIPGPRDTVEVAGDLRGQGRSLFVTRPCYLALRRARRVGVDADGVVVVAEPGRAISSADVADLLGLPVLGVINVDDSVARSVDAGTLVRRTPVLLRDGLRNAG
jgi:hypothetical protein